MRGHSITKILNLPQYRVAGILSMTDDEIHVSAVPYKRKPLVCSGCGEIHAKGGHGTMLSLPPFYYHSELEF